MVICVVFLAFFFPFHFPLFIALTVFSLRPPKDTNIKQTCDVTTGYKKAEKDAQGGKEEPGARTGRLGVSVETGDRENSHCCLRLQIELC